jgi:hypothetical protein
MNFAILNPFKTGNYDQYLNSTGSLAAARRKRFPGLINTALSTSCK